MDFSAINMKAESRPESMPTLEGKRMTMMLAPVKKK